MEQDYVVVIFFFPVPNLSVRDWRKVILPRPPKDLFGPRVLEAPHLRTVDTSFPVLAPVKLKGEGFLIFFKVIDDMSYWRCRREPNYLDFPPFWTSFYWTSPPSTQLFPESPRKFFL